jgi:hypothetical protein
MEQIHISCYVRNNSASVTDTGSGKEEAAKKRQVYQPV